MPSLCEGPPIQALGSSQYVSALSALALQSNFGQNAGRDEWLTGGNHEATEYTDTTVPSIFFDSLDSNNGPIREPSIGI